MIRMPNLTDSFTALESGVFFVDDNICLLGNVAGFFTDTNDNIYTNKRGKDFFEGLYYRFQSGKNIVIIAESDTIQAYRNLFNYMFDTTKYSDRRYNFPQKYAEAITFVDVGLGDDCWIYNKNNIFSLYINYMRDTHMKFDHIIANPPYSLGNQITSTVLNYVDFKEYVNLMPVFRYKGGKIYQHIVPNSLVKVEWVGDASTNPQIAVLTKTCDKNITEAEFNTWCYDEKFKKFYLENQHRDRTWRWESALVGAGNSAQEAHDDIRKKKADPKTSFMFTLRTVENGVHNPNGKKIAWDVRWNLLKNLPIDEIHVYYDKCLKYWHSTIGFLFFDDETKMNNFCKFWYSNEGDNLMNRLLKGLNKRCGSPEDCIPKVDWSREWTDEEILKNYGYTETEIKELLK